MARFRQLVFARDFEPSDEDEARDRGYLSHVLVETDGEQLFPVTFYDAVRLAQDLEENANAGTPMVAEPGMIVLQTITREAMESAARILCEQGYFSHVRPITRAELAASDPYEWPPRRQD
jgi:hypothetical protein